MMAGRYEMRLADYPYAIVRLRCWHCDRACDYRLMRLVVEYGFDIDLMGLLDRLVDDCPSWQWAPDMDGPCGVVFPDLLHDPAPDRPPRGVKLRIVK